MSKFYPPTTVSAIFNASDYDTNDEYLQSSGQFAQSDVVRTVFTGEIDEKENIEFTNTDYSKRFIDKINKVMFTNDSEVDNSLVISTLGTDCIYDASGNVSSQHLFNTLNGAGVPVQSLKLSTANIDIGTVSNGTTTIKNDLVIDNAIVGDLITTGRLITNDSDTTTNIGVNSGGGNYNHVSVAIGAVALRYPVGVGFCTAVGYGSQTGVFGVSTGAYNTSVGASALNATTTGGFNSCIGVNSLIANTSGTSNSALGYTAGVSITTGVNNLCLGKSSGSATSALTLSTQSNTCVIGNNSMTDHYISGSGTMDIHSNSTNLTLYDTPPIITMGALATDLNFGAGTGTTTINNDLFCDGDKITLTNGKIDVTGVLINIGRDTNKYGTNTNAIAIGYTAMKYGGCTNSVAIGGNSCSGAFGTVVVDNVTAVGHQTCFKNTTANNNSAIGYQSMYYGTTASDNTCLGYRSGFNLTTGDNNLCLGHEAGITGSALNLTTEDNTCVIGNNTLVDYHLSSDGTGSTNIINKLTVNKSIVTSTPAIFGAKSAGNGTNYGSTVVDCYPVFSGSGYKKYLIFITDFAMFAGTSLTYSLTYPDAFTSTKSFVVSDPGLVGTAYTVDTSSASVFAITTTVIDSGANGSAGCIIIEGI